MIKPIKKLKFNYFQKIFLSFLLVLLIFIIVIIAFLTTNYRKSMVNVVNNVSSRLLAQSTYSASYLDNIAKQFSNSLYMDNTIINYIYNSSAEDENMVSSKANNMLGKLLASHPYVESVYLYNAKLDKILSTYDGGQYKTDDFADKEIIKMLSDNEFVENYKRTPIPRYSYQILEKSYVYSYLIFEKESPYDTPSAIIINIKASTLTDALTSYYPEEDNLDTQFIITNNKSEVIGYTVPKDLLTNPQTVSMIDKITSNSIQKDNFNYTINKKKYIVSFSNTDYNDWCYISMVPYSDIFGDITRTTCFSIEILVITFLLAIFLCLFLSKRLYNPLKIMMQKVKSKTSKSIQQSKNEDEIRFLTQVFDTMNQQAEEFGKFKDETIYAVKNDFLKSMLTGNMLYSGEKILEIADDMKLSYIFANSMCMCMLKIDSYDSFRSKNNNKERWALRYAIVNLSTEISQAVFDCEICNMDSDKIVMLIDVHSFESFTVFQPIIEKVIKQIQLAVETHLKLTLTATYSSFFNSFDHLPSSYSNLVELSLNKLKYGHGSIINPLMIENDEFINFTIPAKQEEALMDNLNNFDIERANKIYLGIIEQISAYSYGEIMSYIFHLSYFIYSSVQTTHKDFTQNLTVIYKSFLHEVERCEVFTSINEQFEIFITNIYKLLVVDMELNNNSAEFLTQKVKLIIEQNFSDKGLCLNFIADQLNHSSAYLGRVFREVENKSVSKYISEQRMQKISEYLKNTDMSVELILEQVGLEKNNYFYTTFKRYFGMSLNDFKAELK